MPDNDDTITLYGESIARRKFTVSRTEYEQAKADDMVDHLLDAYLSDMSETTTVTEPDGTTYDPYDDITKTWVVQIDEEEWR
ncbi:hypothetical protein ACIA5D_36715 [Actinoplanes sp. NPDC051513]|uniref:hypothetical protein n=1 Tax=Actinoplanes sp. NPDC051513 TaxID=3363908 RepID=UPI0037BBC867